MNRLYLSTIVFIVFIILGIIHVFNGDKITITWFKPFSVVVYILSFLFFVFDIWIWRWRLLHGWFVFRPDLRGTWRIELQSNWKREDGGTVNPISAYFVIRQTFFTLNVDMFTKESTSKIVVSLINKVGDGDYRLVGIYRNEPKLSVRNRSSIHYGAFMLNIQGNPVKSLIGCYWTDRKTCGEIQTLARHNLIAKSFDEAQMLLPSDTESV